jgi:hypothetical protein
MRRAIVVETLRRTGSALDRFEAVLLVSQGLPPPRYRPMHAPSPQRYARWGISSSGGAIWVDLSQSLHSMVSSKVSTVSPIDGPCGPLAAPILGVAARVQPPSQLRLSSSLPLFILLFESLDTASRASHENTESIVYSHNNRDGLESERGPSPRWPSRPSSLPSFPRLRCPIFFPLRSVLLVQSLSLSLECTPREGGRGSLTVVSSARRPGSASR